MYDIVMNLWQLSFSKGEFNAHFDRSNKVLMGNQNSNGCLIHFAVFLAFALNILGSLARSPRLADFLAA